LIDPPTLFDAGEVESIPRPGVHPDGRDDDDVSGAAPSGPLLRVRAVVAYDGTDFHGFAAQPGLRTVAGELAGALGRVLGHEVVLTAAGRTDKGVHARGQVVSFDTPSTFDPAALARAVNRQIGPRVAVREVAVVPYSFDARFSARGRRYRYQVLMSTEPDPFLAGTAWHVGRTLDVASMRLACDPLIGEHDFASFCRRPRGAPDASLVRHVRRAGWSVQGDLARFDIEASSFCHQMVRSLVGTLVDVGRGARRAGEMSAIVRAAHRDAAGQVAPPHGLCLMEVTY